MIPPIVDFEAVTSDLNTWKNGRNEILAGLRQRLGHLPELPDQVSFEILDKHDYDLGMIEKLRLNNGTKPGISAWFAYPKTVKKQGPSVLWCHWHGGEYAIGKEELFEHQHTPQSPLQCFLEMGRSVLCIDAYGFGERNGCDSESCGDRGQEGEHSLFKNFLWQGSSLWGRMLWDDRLAFRFLQQRPEVDPKRISAAGLSMGATRTQWLMAFEETLACGVAIACIVRYRDLVEVKGLKRHGMYFYVPGLLEFCDLESILSLAAPRPLLCLNGGDDLLSPMAGIERVGELVSRVYGLYDKEDQFRSAISPNVGHQCTVEMWGFMRQWISKV